MKILILGAGAIGSAFGGFLSGHHDVTLLGRRPHMEAVRKHGLQVTGIWGRHTFRFKELVTRPRDLDLARPFDLILCTVKSYDTPEAALMIRKILGPKTRVVSLQNGLGNIETLAQKIPPERVFGGRVIFGVEQNNPGKIHISVIAAPTAVGDIRKRVITPSVREISKLFNEAGIPSVAVSDLRSLLWAKVIYNAALNPLASLLETHYGFLGERPALRATMDAVMEEIYAVAHKARIRLKHRSVAAYRKLFYGELLPRTFDHHPSMLQDLRRGKRTEIDALNGKIVALGRRYKVAVPMNKLLTHLIRAEEIKRNAV